MISKKNHLTRKVGGLDTALNVGEEDKRGIIAVPVSCREHISRGPCLKTTGCKWEQVPNSNYYACIYDDSLFGGGANKITSKRSHKKNKTLSKRQSRK
jgi:hypothetical protein